jgi:hypothetical protein
LPCKDLEKREFITVNITAATGERRVDKLLSTADAESIYLFQDSSAATCSTPARIVVWVEVAEKDDLVGLEGDFLETFAVDPPRDQARFGIYHLLEPPRMEAPELFGGLPPAFLLGDEKDLA